MSLAPPVVPLELFAVSGSDPPVPREMKDDESAKRHEVPWVFQPVFLKLAVPPAGHEQNPSHWHQGRYGKIGK